MIDIENDFKLYSNWNHFLSFSANIEKHTIMFFDFEIELSLSYRSYCFANRFCLNYYIIQFFG